MKVKSVKNRRKFVTAVYVEGNEEPFLFDTTVCEIERVFEKTEISDEEVVRLSRLSARNKAKERALRLLEFRPHSEKELFDKLKRDYDEETSAFAVSEMHRLGLTNDRAFAEMLYKSLTERKKYSVSRAKQELRQKGISSEIISEICEEIEVDSDLQIRAIIEKRFTPLPEDEKGVRRMINYMLRQGFRYGEINNILKEYDKEYD